MFNLIRRISGVFPRSTRTWRSQGPDSPPAESAPQVGRKRRRSSTTEPDEILSAKKAKIGQGAVAEAEVPSDEAPTRDESPKRAPETEEVKEVTKGVKEVELDDKGPGKTLAEIAPEGEASEKTCASPEISETTTVDPEPEVEDVSSPEVETSPLQDDATSGDGPPATEVEDEPSFSSESTAVGDESKTEGPTL